MTDRYTLERINHWNHVANQQKSLFSTFYHKLLCHYYRFFIPPGLRILEIGSGEGDLLHRLRPAYGLGIDFSENMVSKASEKYSDLEFRCIDAHKLDTNEQFDIIIMSDILNDCQDIQEILTKIKRNCHEKTRIIINYFNNFWRIPLTIARHLKLARPVLEQNWLTPHDIKNFLILSVLKNSAFLN